MQPVCRRSAIGEIAGVVIISSVKPKGTHIPALSFGHIERILADKRSPGGARMVACQTSNNEYGHLGITPISHETKNAPISRYTLLGGSILAIFSEM